MRSADRSQAEVLTNALGAHLAAVGLADWDGGTMTVGTEYDGATEWPQFMGPNMPMLARVLVLTPTATTTLRASVTQSFQIRARDRADAQVWDIAAKLQQIRDHFTPGGHPRSSFLLGDVAVSKVVTLDPTILPDDAERRPGATLNLTIHARRIASVDLPPVVTPQPDPVTFTDRGDGIYVATGLTPAPGLPGLYLLETTA